MCAMTGLNIQSLALWEWVSEGHERGFLQRNMSLFNDSKESCSDIERLCKTHVAGASATLPKRTYSPIYLFNHSLHKKAAFTLAEVLITLGVIGVVAALTIPTLISKHRAEVTMTKIKKFYSVMSQAQIRSIIDNGDVETWDFVSDGGVSGNEIVLNWFNKYWRPYLNSVEVIDRKILKDDAVLDGGIAVKMADGSIAVFSYFSGGYMHITLYTAPKTFYDNTAIDGKDAFLFGFNQTNAIRFEVYGQNDPRWSDVEQLKYNSWGGCYKENTSNGHPLCTRLLQINGWKVPEDYPYRF